MGDTSVSYRKRIQQNFFGSRPFLPDNLPVSCSQTGDAIPGVSAVSCSDGDVWCWPNPHGPQLLADPMCPFSFKKDMALRFDAPPYQWSNNADEHSVASLHRIGGASSCNVIIDEPVYQFMDKKRSEGKPYRSHMMASANSSCASTTLRESHGGAMIFTLYTICAAVLKSGLIL